MWWRVINAEGPSFFKYSTMSETLLTLSPPSPCESMLVLGGNRIGSARDYVPTYDLFYRVSARLAYTYGWS